MTTGQKIMWISFVVAFVVLAMVVLTAGWDAIREMTDVAASDPSAANYTGYSELVTSAPWWLYFIPPIVGIAVVFSIIRAKEA